ncbi:xanthine dehydrogenase family protein molybdopterin-binding subunit [Pseudonocardia acaciae]|uniref:xanthine dehydrogenase family protein molybdopterin-binding subunit n=1 Tax=Pseudonocardia acaciae TaxID=551276 RepID=UPI000491F9F0|nr:xanthine dehydrogenase family protein molybdopterin-binding subunit [Pseudonocardia acaciae]
MRGSILGTEVRRVEDPELIRGQGTYVDNLDIPGALHATFVRSPLAHARITGVDTAEAEKAPGVRAVYTAESLGLSPQLPPIPVNPTCARPPLAQGKVRFVGDAVALVVADTKSQAEDAAELVVVDYDPLDPVVDMEAALDPASPQQFEELGSNIAAAEREPDGEDPLAGADAVVRLTMRNQRLAAMPMEPNAMVAVPGGVDGADHDATVYVSTQAAHMFQMGVAAGAGMAPDRLRVISPHVGGGFGAKIGAQTEHMVVLAAARKLERPVKWIETRSENALTMPQGRGQQEWAELGLRKDGTIVGLRLHVIADCGAYAGFNGFLGIVFTRLMAAGVYRIPRISYTVAAALTNTTPMGAFRGAGRPEATALLERIMDLAAGELKIDPAELRRRNFIQPGEFPHTTVVGAKYDTGDYDMPLRKALELADYDGLRAEQARRRERGDAKQLGIGVSTYVEVTGGGNFTEYSSVEVHPDGGATIKVGTSAHGQGHATAFSMIVSDRLGIPIEKIKFLQSDTAEVPRGGGTMGSRSLQIGGNAVNRAAEVVLESARELAADLLEADAADIEVTDDGDLGVAGVPDRSIGWDKLSQAAAERGKPLSVALDWEQSGGSTFPFGAHVSVVEVDTDTGKATPLKHYAVDDCGRILNPMLVAGQQHGGLAQGMAQVLYEHFVYDEDGNPTTATLTDYTIPSAADLPWFDVSNTETPTPYNPLGAKGIGESATVGSTPAVHNAIVDAVSHLGVRHIELPCTPHAVWRAVHDAKAGTPADPWREPPAVFATLPERAPVDPNAGEPVGA